MKTLLTVCLALILAGCNRPHDPLGPVLEDLSGVNKTPTPGTTHLPTPGLSWNTVYTNPLTSLADANDFSVFSAGSAYPLPTIYTATSHSGGVEAIYTANSDSSSKTYYKNLFTTAAQLRATYWVYGITDSVSLGLVSKVGSTFKAGFRFNIVGSTGRTISVYDTSISSWVPVVTTSNTPAVYDVWRQLTVVLDLSTGLSEYYVNGSLVASGVNSSGASALTTPISAGWSSVINFGVTGPTLQIDDITLETK